MGTLNLISLLSYAIAFSTVLKGLIDIYSNIDKKVIDFAAFVSQLIDDYCKFRKIDGGYVCGISWNDWMDEVFFDNSKLDDFATELVYLYQVLKEMNSKYDESCSLLSLLPNEVIMLVFGFLIDFDMTKLIYVFTENDGKHIKRNYWLNGLVLN